MESEIIVTDWEKVEPDDFYLSPDWAAEAGKEAIKKAKQLQRDGNLYYAYAVSALHYALYVQMDAQQILIDRDGAEILECESAIIENKHKERWQREV